MPEKFKTPFAEYDQLQRQIAETDPAQLAKTAAEQARAQEEEYGAFVAAEPIYVGPVLAFGVGHKVPQSSVSDEGPVYPNQVALARDGEGKLTGPARRMSERAAKAVAAPVETPDEAAASAAPAGNASAEEWRAYAVAQGMDEAEAAGMSRDQLRDHFQG